MQRSLLLACAVLAAPGLAGAGEVCVRCENPGVTYRCSLEKSAELEKYGVEDKVVPPLCERVLAKLGRHQSCRAVAAGDEPCDGVAKTLSLSDLQKAAAGGSGDSVVPSLGERAEDAAKSAGESIGGVFKKSWTCVTTLFQECG